MYTTKINEKKIIKPQNIILITVEFSNGVDVFENVFRFGFSVTYDEVKKRINEFLREIEQSNLTLESISLGQLDLSGITPVLTQAEREKEQWFSDLGKLERATKLIGLGVLIGTETGFVNLKTKVKNNFKPVYLTEI